MTAALVRNFNLPVIPGQRSDFAGIFDIVWKLDGSVAYLSDSLSVHIVAAGGTELAHVTGPPPIEVGFGLLLVARGMAIAPDGLHVYAAAPAGLHVINTTSNVATWISLPSTPFGVAVNASWVYAVAQGDDQTFRSAVIYQINPSTGAVNGTYTIFDAGSSLGGFVRPTGCIIPPIEGKLWAIWASDNFGSGIVHMDPNADWSGGTTPLGTGSYSFQPTSIWADATGAVYVPDNRTGIVFYNGGFNPSRGSFNVGYNISCILADPMAMWYAMVDNVAGLRMMNVDTDLFVETIATVPFPSSAAFVPNSSFRYVWVPGEALVGGSFVPSVSIVDLNVALVPSVVPGGGSRSTVTAAPRLPLARPID